MPQTQRAAPRYWTGLHRHARLQLQPPRVTVSIQHRRPRLATRCVLIFSALSVCLDSGFHAQCGRVRDAKEDAVQNCTNANDTRVAQCREDPVKGEYTLVRGATGVAPTPDTCWDTPPSVYLSYDGDYDAVTRTASAYDAFEASFKEKLGFRNAFVDPSAAHVRFGSCSESCFGAGEFLRIPVNRVAVESVVPGSVGVYFYLLQRAPSAPLNEYGVEEAYAYLDSAFTSGTPKLAASERLRSRA